MSLARELEKRSNGKCELCSSEAKLSTYLVPPNTEITAEYHIYICSVCKEQIDNPELVEPNHWRCLNDSMWSTIPAVQVVAWRMLSRLKGEGWPQDLLDMLYLEDAVLTWAKSTSEAETTQNSVIHRDVNGNILQAGDSVVLIKDLKVKGTSMVAKQGTAVRRISLDSDNADYIEGKVDGQHIVIITQYVKKIA